MDKNGFFTIFISDFSELAKARWYQAYVLLFFLAMVMFIVFGLTESSYMGFTGLSRILLTYIQAVIIVLPIFILITTVRTFVGDRETGVLEYILSWPVSLSSFYWGKTLGRATAIILPVLLAIMFAVVYQIIDGGIIPWNALFWISGFVVSLTFCFIGMSILISVCVKNQEQAIGCAFLLWLTLESVIDSLLLGLLVQQRLTAEVIVAIALINPIQIFRTASIAVFDPEMSLFGPIALTLLDFPGPTGLNILAVVWPIVIGGGCAIAGLKVFTTRDLVS